MRLTIVVAGLAGLAACTADPGQYAAAPYGAAPVPYATDPGYPGQAAYGYGSGTAQPYGYPGAGYAPSYQPYYAPGYAPPAVVVAPVGVPAVGLGVAIGGDRYARERYDRERYERDRARAGFVPGGPRPELRPYPGQQRPVPGPVATVPRPAAPSQPPPGRPPGHVRQPGERE